MLKRLRWITLGALVITASPVFAHPFFVWATFPGKPAPVILELFTSQGCSSCPPAEAFLNSWGQSQFQKGKVIPLAFHVDYWNNLGWSDPFSSVDFTARQKSYEDMLGRDSLYTPQAVLGGQVDAAGCDTQFIENRVAALTTIQAVTGLSLTARRRKGQLEIEVKTRDAEKPGDAWVLNLVVFENGLVTPVAQGENRGRTLTESFVARLFKKIDPVQESQTYSNPWNSKWKAQNAGVAAYLQDRRSLRIDSSAAVYPIP
ncbi:MAG: DUF1223 domain-containing protein [bacterium]